MKSPLTLFREWAAHCEANRVEARKKYLRNQLDPAMAAIDSSDNEGLIWRRLVNLPGVSGGSYSTGWTNYGDITMDDGYLVSHRSTGFVFVMLTELAHKVADRIREVNVLAHPAGKGEG